jgi:hypothetical protein
MQSALPSAQRSAAHQRKAQSAKSPCSSQLVPRRTADSGAPSDSRLGTSGFRLVACCLLGVGCWAWALALLIIDYWAPGSRLRLPAPGLGFRLPAWAWANGQLTTWNLGLGSRLPVTPGFRASGLRLGMRGVFCDSLGLGRYARACGCALRLTGALCTRLLAGRRVDPLFVTVLCCYSPYLAR